MKSWEFVPDRGASTQPTQGAGVKIAVNTELSTTDEPERPPSCRRDPSRPGGKCSAPPRSPAPPMTDHGGGCVGERRLVPDCSRSVR